MQRLDALRLVKEPAEIEQVKAKAGATTTELEETLRVILIRFSLIEGGLDHA
jgi:hypothetical protein